MKQMIFLGAIIALAWGLPACQADSRYVDPNTGEALELVEDPETGLMVDKETGEPVELYVDTQTKDTIQGRTGKVVNGSLRKGDNGTYTYVEVGGGDGEGGTKVKRTDDETKIKRGDYKKEVEKDGDITIKDGDTKIKIDGETGERKVKRDD